MPEHNANEAPLHCYRCGAALAALTLPLSRRDLCPGCSVELHVCRMCVHFAPGKPDDCNEEDAEAVSNKTGANFCEFFAPDPAAFDGREQRAAAAAHNQLAALFGDLAEGSAEAPANSALTEAEKLFGK